MLAARLKEIESIDDAAQGGYRESACISILRKLHTNASIHYRRPVIPQSQPDST